MDEVSEMYLPLEGHGVDSTWELRLPRASNRFDFRTLMDVLISEEYSALHSFDYANQVIQQLKPNLEADRAFSFRQQFADAWYDLHNPQLLPEPERLVVQFKISREDFPANLEDLRMRHLTLYFVRADDLRQEVPVTHLKLTDAGNVTVKGGVARSIDGAISTRRGNGATWLPLLGGGLASGGRSSFGTWELNLRPNDAFGAQQLQDCLKTEQIEDILLVISYAGRTPDWPE